MCEYGGYVNMGDDEEMRKRRRRKKKFKDRSF